MRTYVNSVFPATTLNGAINNSQTTITVFSEANLPGSGQYVISIDSEYMLVTAGYGTLTLTVTRGIEATSGASHSSGASVYHPLSTGTLDAIRQDIHQVGVYASLPATATSKKGDTYRCTDAPYNFWFDGSAWKAQFNEWQVFVPPSAGWTWDNQGSGTVDSSAGQAYFTLPRSGVNSMRMWYRSAPATPFKVVFCFRSDISGAGDAGSSGVNVYASFAFRDASGKFQTLGLGNSGGSGYVTVDNWTNSTNFISNAYSYVANGAIGITNSAAPRWVRIQDTGTNLIYEWSIDGYNWVNVLTQSRTTFLTSGPNAYAVGGYINGDAVRLQLISLQEQ